ncbi:MAG: hypothetical protein JW741_24735, partial [Sedimentisphaerales bacterium]|nr:hypothetical protein [Sedimentisphaerales bacterium]
MGKSLVEMTATDAIQPTDAGQSRRRIAVLFTCIGRRVSLLRCFARAARKLRLHACLCGTDTTSLSPALQLCDEAFLVKPTTHARYISQLLSIVREHDVRLLIPTVDLDLPLLAQNKSRFERLGCRVLVSDPEAIDICRDKRRTFGFLTRHGFGTPETMSVRTTLAADRKRKLAWPRFVKRWDGYAGRDNALVRTPAELRWYDRRIPNAICQELMEGAEYTCDVYIDFEMRVRCV